MQNIRNAQLLGRIRGVPVEDEEEEGEDKEEAEGLKR